MNNLRIRYDALIGLIKQLCTAVFARSRPSSQAKRKAVKDILAANRFRYVHDTALLGDVNRRTNTLLAERYGIKVVVGLSYPFTKDEEAWCFSYNEMAQAFYTFLFGRNVFVECKRDAEEQVELNRDRDARDIREKARTLVRNKSTAEEIAAAYPNSVAVSYSPAYALHMLEVGGDVPNARWQKIARHANTIRVSPWGAKVYFYFDDTGTAVDHEIKFK